MSDKMIKELREWAKGCTKGRECCPGYLEFSEILSRYTPAEKEEPLANMVAKAGLSPLYVSDRKTGHWPEHRWMISLKCGVRKFTGPTYEAAEKAAREWLLKQEDKV